MRVMKGVYALEEACMRLKTRDYVGLKTRDHALEEA
jgi:hypothetical protein